MQIFRLIVHYGSIAALAATSLGQADKPTMKGVVIHQYGGPEVLKIRGMSPQPEPKQNELLIKCHRGWCNTGRWDDPIGHVRQRRTPRLFP